MPTSTITGGATNLTVGGMVVTAQGHSGPKHQEAAAESVLPFTRAGLNNIDIGNECGITISPPVTPPINNPNFPNDPYGPGGIAWLTASASGAGIYLNWNYPVLRPQAVAHILVYRNTTNSFANASVVATVGGSSYQDPSSGLELYQVYYYWVRTRSTGGVLGELNGPAHATAEGTMADFLIDLTDQINDTQLSKDLKTNIGIITDGASALTTATQVNAAGFAIFDELLDGVTDGLAAIDTLVYQNNLSRITGDDAVVGRVDLLLAKSNSNAAAILDEQVVRATKTDALALNIHTLQATADDQSASVQVLEKAEVLNGEARASYMVKTDVNGYVAGFGLYNEGPNAPGFKSGFIVHADLFAVGLPSNVRQTVTDANGNDTGETAVPLDPTVYPFSVSYVTNSEGKKEPRISLNGRSMIPDASIGNAQLTGTIRSDVLTYTEGWAINPDGTAVFANVTVRGNIEATSISADKINIVDTKDVTPGSITLIKTATYSPNPRSQKFVTNGKFFEKYKDRNNRPILRSVSSLRAAYGGIDTGVEQGNGTENRHVGYSRVLKISIDWGENKKNWPPFALVNGSVNFAGQNTSAGGGQYNASCVVRLATSSSRTKPEEGLALPGGYGNQADTQVIAWSSQGVPVYAATAGVFPVKNRYEVYSLLAYYYSPTAAMKLGSCNLTVQGAKR